MHTISRKFQGLPLRLTIFKTATFCSASSTPADCNNEPSELPRNLAGWISCNRLFQRHPRLHYLENHCRSLQQLKQVLSYVFVSGLRRNPFVMSRVLFFCLHELEGDIKMKSSFGVQVFDQIDEPNKFSWNAIIRFFAVSDEPGTALIGLQYYTRMLRRGIFPDKYTFPFLLQVCGSVSECTLVKQVQCHVIKLGFDQDMFVQNALIDAYLDCGVLSDARVLFDEMVEKDVVSWTTLISGNVAQGCYREALNIFCEMLGDDFETRPNVATIVSVLSACGNLGSLDLTKCFHVLLLKGGWTEMDVSIGNSLIDAYAKCGSLNSAAKAFKDIGDDQRDVYTWTSIIFGLAIHGQGMDAYALFFDMVRVSEIVPDAVTLTAVLSACAHSGLVQEGLGIFESMKLRYGIEPNLKHYGCIIDLLGKAGMLEKAYQILETMPVRPNLAIFASLLSACRIHKNMDFAEIISRKIKSLSGGGSGGAPVLLSNIYANENRWNEVIHIRRGMRAEVNEKTPGQSWVQVKDTVHEFFVGDKSHPEAMHLSFLLQGLERQGKTK